MLLLMTILPLPLPLYLLQLLQKFKTFGTKSGTFELTLESVACFKYVFTRPIPFARELIYSFVGIAIRQQNHTAKGKVKFSLIQNGLY